MTSTPIPKNTLSYGDCLKIMQTWDDACVDLIYLDPPFNSNAKYSILFGKEKDDNKAQLTAFSDMWFWDEPAIERVSKIKNAIGHPAHYSISGLHITLGDCGMMSYLSYMAERLSEMKRVLKSTGSIYLHCDPTASHYLKILMDNIFNRKNFRSEIIWNGGSVSGFKSQKKGWIRQYDNLLFYTKGKDFTFHKEMLPYKKEYIKKMFKSVDEEGRKYRDRGYKRFYSDEGGMPVSNNWTDIYSMQTITQSKEKVGYPTQKPMKLLERIIKASSDEGDVVLDPFCGCGTAIEAAENLGRKWIGIDISAFAIDLIQTRRFPNQKLQIKGIPEDFSQAKKMARENPFDFEKWAITRIPGMLPNNKQRGDGGVDGRGTLHNWSGYKNKLIDERKGLVLAQVKGGSFKLSHLRDFLHVIEREKAPFGIFITLGRTTSNNAKAEAGVFEKIEIGTSKYERVQLYSVEEYFDDKKTASRLIPPLADPFTGKVMQSLLFI